MKGISSLAHIALKVRDMERSLDFYVRQMEFPEMFRLKREGKLWIVYLRVTDDQYIELFPDGIGDHAPDRDQTGVNHFCLGVDDIDAVVAQLRKNGVAITVEKKMGADHNYQAWIADPDGNRIELMQMMPKAMQLEAIRQLRAGNTRVAEYEVTG
jgi:lactoylglutathione lyase